MARCRRIGSLQGTNTFDDVRGRCCRSCRFGGFRNRFATVFAMRASRVFRRTREDSIKSARNSTGRLTCACLSSGNPDKLQCTVNGTAISGRSATCRSPEISQSGRAGGQRRFRTLTAVLSEAIDSIGPGRGRIAKATLHHPEHSRRRVPPGT